MKPLALALSGLVLVADPSFAQEAKQLSEIQIRATLLNSGDAAFAAPAVRGEALDTQRLMTNDSARLLDGMPGVSFYAGGGVSSLPVIDGLADDRLRLLVDGKSITASCPNHMNPALSYIDPAAVESVNVFAGISPVSLGGDSIGGTIAIRSAEPIFAKAGEGVRSNGSVSAFHRSNGNVSGGNIRLSLAGEGLSVSYSGATVESDDYKDGNGRLVRSTEYKAQNNQLTLAAKLPGGFVSLDLAAQHIPYQGYPNQFMDMTDNRSVSWNLHYKDTFSWGQFDARAFRQRVRHKMDMLGDKANLGLATMGMAYAMPMDTEGIDAGYSVQADIPLSGRDLLRVGHELHRYTLDDWWPPIPGSMMMGPNAFWNINDGKRQRVALFAEWEAKWSPAWTSQLGVRYEHVTMDTGNVQGYYSSGESMMFSMPDGSIYQADADAFNARNHKRSDNNVDLTAVARYEPDRNSSFDFGFARKVRSPNLYERFAWSNEATMAGAMISWFGDLNSYVGDLDLKPEVAHTLRATADWHDAEHKAWQFRASPFYTHVSDFINVEANASAVLPANTGRAALRFANHDARLVGLDVSASLQVAQQWAARGTFSYVRGRDLDADTNLYDIMPANLRLALDHHLGAWASSVEIQAVAAKNKLDAVRLEQKTAGYTLLNLRTGYDWGRFRIDAAIDNLFDRQYNLPLGGLDFYEYNYHVTVPGVTSGTLMPVRGMGRSVNVGLTLKF